MSTRSINMDSIVTPKFRLSFPNLNRPKSFEGQEPKYSVVMLFSKKEDLAELKKMAAAARDAKWPDAKKRPSNLKNPFRDGDVERTDTDGYAGHIFITASSKMKPGVVDKNCQPIMDIENECYAGCYCKARLTCYAYDKAGNKGVAFGLQHVQKVADGEPFNGRMRAEEAFEVIEETADTDAMFDL